MTATNLAAHRGVNLGRANGIDVAYTDVGDGPPLVLLHGGLVSTGPARAGSPVAHVDQLAALGKHFEPSPPTPAAPVRRCIRADPPPSTSSPTT